MISRGRGEEIVLRDQHDQVGLSEEANDPLHHILQTPSAEHRTLIAIDINNLY